MKPVNMKHFIPPKSSIKLQDIKQSSLEFNYHSCPEYIITTVRANTVSNSPLIFNLVAFL
jgi:hypothetical protein